MMSPHQKIEAMKQEGFTLFLDHSCGLYHIVPPKGLVLPSELEGKYTRPDYAYEDIMRFRKQVEEEQAKEDAKAAKETKAK